jgi:hypothetical protein
LRIIDRIALIRNEEESLDNKLKPRTNERRRRDSVCAICCQRRRQTTIKALLQIDDSRDIRRRRFSNSITRPTHVRHAAFTFKKDGNFTKRRKQTIASCFR